MTSDLMRCSSTSARFMSALTPLLMAVFATSVAQAQPPIKHWVDITVPGQASIQLSSAANLLYYGGRIVTNPKYYNVYWGSSVNRYGGQIDAYVTDLGSLYYNTLLSQYATAGHNPGTNQITGPGSFGGAIVATPSSDSTTVDDLQIQAQLQAWIQAGTIPAPTQDAGGNNDTIYIVLFPPDVTVILGGAASCVRFCAYHSTVAAGGVTSEFYYAVLPDQGGACNGVCGGAPGILQNLTSVLSHEVAETITDAEVGLANNIAFPLAWYDANTSDQNGGGEVADICNAEQGSMTGPTGTTWVMQKLWSNADGVCEVATKVLQIITFNSLPGKTVGSPSFNLTATSNTGLAITYTGGFANVCSVTSGGQVTILGPGTCPVTANQNGGVIGVTTYEAANSVTQTFLITSGGGTQTPVSVTPNSGSGAGPQVFTALYTDSAGASNFEVVYLDFGSVYFAAHNCIVSYVPGANQLYLYKDDNSGALGPITLGSGGSLSNSQCKVLGGSTSATLSGTSLSVPFDIQFLAGYGGLKQVFGLTQEFSGVQSGGGVPTDLGTWTPAATTPNVVGVVPNSGSGTGPQIFTAQFSDSGGANDLQAVYLDFASVYFAAHNCEVVYTPGLNQLYLFNDGNNGALGPISLGAGGGTLSNSQCTLSSGTTAATLSGNNLTVPFTITFKAGYGGLKTIFALSQTYAGVQSGGGVPATLGSWTTSASTPAAVSVTPDNGTGSSQVFTAVYTDTGGGNDLQVVDLTFGPALNAASSCAVVYTPGLNQLYLYNDAGNGVLGPISEGAGGGSLSNSQCTLSSGTNAATLTGAGNPTTLNVPFNITFKGTFTGTKTAWGYAQTYGGTDSAVTNLGSWTP
jgi:hypothetical protein